jgi:hypothetical protein
MLIKIKEITNKSLYHELRYLEKQEQIKPSISRWKEKIKKLMTWIQKTPQIIDEIKRLIF